jgi:hypothetical protein
MNVQRGIYARLRAFRFSASASSCCSRSCRRRTSAWHCEKALAASRTPIGRPGRTEQRSGVFQRLLHQGALVDEGHLVHRARR